MQICAKISVICVLLHPHQQNHRGDTTLDMFPTKSVYQYRSTKDGNLAEEQREFQEVNYLLGNAANISLGGKVWLNIKEEYMKDSNTLVGNAANNSLRRDIWIHTRWQFMKE